LGAMRELEEELGVKLYEEDLKNYEKIFEFTVDVEKEMR
jgi:acyl carrier protein